MSDQPIEVQAVDVSVPDTIESLREELAKTGQLGCLLQEAKDALMEDNKMLRGQLAEARKDTELLDWLETQLGRAQCWGINRNMSREFNLQTYNGDGSYPTARATIAAAKEQA